MTAIRFATREELQSLALLLCESFDDDPAWNFVLPTARLRSLWLAQLMYIGLEVAMDHGLVWVVADKASGTPMAVAMWYPAGQPFPPPWYRTLWPAIRIMDFSLLHFPAAWRLARVQRLMLRLRPTSLTRCWYLVGLAVARTCRGAGLGSLLVEEGMARAAAHQAPAFLQAWDNKLSFYERLGFKSISQFSLPNRSNSCHGMLWQPQPLPESLGTVVHE